MHKKLPARPNLEHLRSQAKALLTAFKADDPQAVRDFADHYDGHPTDAVRLADAQLVVARKNGFRSWPKLVHYVEQLRALEGTWHFTSLEIEGSGQPTLALSASKLIINGDRFRMESKEANYEGIFDINVEVTPHTIDIDFVEGPEAGNSSYGIYEFEGDDLKICLGLTGYPRPSDFRTTPGSGHALETLQRGDMDNRLAASPSRELPAQERDLASHEGFDAMTPELELLQGEWVATSLIRDGMVLPSQFYESGKRVAQGNVTTVTFGNQVWMRALTRIDASQDPQAIDYLHLEGPAAGQIQRGILSLALEEVQFCLAEPGAPRPSEFTSKPGSAFTLSTWRRKS
jgi:uncharacterized protein (TIGR03067 family)